MEYPTKLLPLTLYKQIEADLSNHHICRTTRSRDFLNENNLIKDEELCEKPTEFFDYSTNHLGQFRFIDNYLSLTGENKKYFRLYWDFTTPVETPRFKEDFICDESKGCFFFKIGDIHNQIKFPITNSEKKTDQIKAIIKHTPSNSNFWHFSIKWVDQNNNEISSNDSKWKHPIMATIRAKLQEIFITDCPEPIEINKQDYLK